MTRHRPRGMDAALAPEDSVVAELRARGVSVADDRLSRLAKSHDASHFQLTPAAVISAAGEDQVARTLAAAARHGATVTFRSGGTSLSGQGLTNGLLVDTRRGFRRFDVLDDGRLVRCQPGVTLAAVNARLRPLGRRLGPDPASEIACTVGGAVANNSSGMTCGTHANPYATLASVRVVLPSGTVVDTGAGDADEALRQREPELYTGLLALRDAVRADPAAVATIRRLFAIKNTMGYGVNALLDAERPVDLVRGLVVGSEGTLGFIAEAALRTLPIRPAAATGLLVFPDLAQAAAALPTLADTDLVAIEVMDAAGLRVAQRAPGAPAVLRELTVRTQAALLVELQAADAEELAQSVAALAPLLGTLGTCVPATLTEDAAVRASLWRVRKGLYAAVAGNRRPGSTALLEDVAVPMDALEKTCVRLGTLFSRHGYEDAVVFGHARDGNLHFMLEEQFEQPKAVDRYAAFTEDLVELILDHGGTLKAEHGTGRVMAPYLRRQYGDFLADVMVRLKQLFDPTGVLAPGVLINDDPRAHLRDLKSLPVVEPDVDRCTGCGFCETVCPSRDLTLTPRERIALHRESARVGAPAAAGEADYRYALTDTCAADGLCELACPVGINTGDLVRTLRAEAVGPIADRLGVAAARQWAGVTRTAAAALSVAHAVGPVATAATALGRPVLGAERVPRYDSGLPRGAAPLPVRPVANPDAVVFTSCLGGVFAPEGRGDGVAQALLALTSLAGLRVGTLAAPAGLCCGTPWKSKGLIGGYRVMSERVRRAVAEVDADVPIVVDATSCTEGLRLALAGSGRRVIDAVEFVATTVLPRVGPVERMPSLVLHPTCSGTRLGLDDHVHAVANVIAEQVIVPESAGCCGFAGDRGLLHPELTASATAAEAHEVRTLNAAAYASTNRTCEVGLTRATGRPYRHLLELLSERLAPGR